MTYRVLGVAAIVVCLVSICAVIAAVVLKGGIATSGPSVASLVAFLGLLTTSLVTVLSVTNVQAKLNGHIAKHEAAVTAAENAAAGATSVGEQLAEARRLLDQIHYDTNSRFAAARKEVVDLTEEVRRLRDALAESNALPPESGPSPAADTPT